jgi:hypothetical protein
MNTDRLRAHHLVTTPNILLLQDLLPNSQRYMLLPKDLHHPSTTGRQLSPTHPSYHRRQALDIREVRRIMPQKQMRLELRSGFGTDHYNHRCTSSTGKQLRKSTQERSF